MKKYGLLLCLVCSAFGVQAQVNAESIVNDFLIPSAGGLFRGFDFTSLEDTIETIENSRPFMEYEYDDMDEDWNYILGYNLYFNNSDKNYAYIDYTIDFVGIYEVIAAIYLESDKGATDVFNQLFKHYKSKLGASTQVDNGWTKFSGEYKQEPYDVYIFLDEDDSGKYIRYELHYSGYE